MLYDLIGRKALFMLDAESAHGLSIKALRSGFFREVDNGQDPRLAVEMAGLKFPNPLGMAAGYDKNADVPDSILKLGFGHAEIGTVTPKPQPGNPKPRIFRLVADKGVINRLGFNSGGHAAARQNMERFAARAQAQGGIVGVNIGANKASEDFGADYVDGIHAFGDIASYFTINISSPNTPGLRNLQEGDPLTDLLGRVSTARQDVELKTQRRVPLFLKIAPDLEDAELDSIALALERSDFDGLVVSNTTIARDGLRSSNASEAGGLSGSPLFEKSTIVLAKMYQRVSLPIIGVGGISDANSAFDKLQAGATLIQLYSGMIYAGPSLPEVILKGLSKRLDQEGLSSIAEVTGRRADAWASASG